LSFVQSNISGNSARNGGGIFRKILSSVSPQSALTVGGSAISGNTADLRGGGIYNQGGFVSITSSTIVNNTAAKLQGGAGGGVFNSQADLSILNSSVSGNSALQGMGGGIYHNIGDLTAIGSTIAGNSALQNGGGVFASTSSSVDRITVHSSTVSGNTSQGTGGLYLRGNSTIRHSTIAGNTGGFNGTGGLFAGNGSQQLELDHTIIAGNHVSEEGSPDIRYFLNASAVTMRYSLIGSNAGTSLVEAPLGSPDVNGNLIGKPVETGGSGVIDPLLAPLAGNGGPTRTHALLPGSPALDGGALITGPPQGYDQRGNPFSRMVDGTGDGVVRIDIGAYESQGVPHFSPGDFNRDGIVDACDYSIWRDMLGSDVEPFEGADASGDGVVNFDDYAIWKSHFGQGLVFTVGGGGGGAMAATAEPALGVSFDLGLTQLSPSTTASAIGHTRRGATTLPAVAEEQNALLVWLATRLRGVPIGDDVIPSHEEDADANDADASREAIDTAFALLGE
jgi:hypothetical protein